MEDFDKDYYEDIDDPEELNDLEDFYNIQESFFWNEKIDKLVWASKHSVFEDLNSYDDYEKPYNERNYVTSCYSDDIWKIEFLKKWKTRELLLKYRKLWDKGPEWLNARNKIVKSNLRFVYDIAKPIYDWFKSEYSWVNAELSDVIQAWNIWLIKSLQKYKPRDVKSFLYHAKYTIKNSIYRYLKYDIRFFGSWDDRHPIWTSKHIRKFINDYYNKNLVEPTDYEIKDFIKNLKIDSSNTFSDDYGYYYKYYLKLGNISLDQPAEQWQLLWIENETTLSNRTFMIDNEDNCLYNDDPYNDNWEVTLKDTLLDPLGNDADRWAFLDSLRYELKTAFIILTDDEKYILKSYFWLDWNRPLSLNEIADKMGKTYERVRQLKERALKVLRWFDKNLLKEYLYAMKDRRLRFNTRNDILQEFLQE